MTAEQFRRFREAQAMSRSEFGAWLANLIGNEKPYSYQRIADFENGARSVPKDIVIALLQSENLSLKSQIAQMTRGGTTPPKSEKK